MEFGEWDNTTTAWDRRTASGWKAGGETKSRVGEPGGERGASWDRRTKGQRRPGRGLEYKPNHHNHPQACKIQDQKKPRGRRPLNGGGEGTRYGLVQYLSELRRPSNRERDMIERDVPVK